MTEETEAQIVFDAMERARTDYGVPRFREAAAFIEGVTFAIESMKRQNLQVRDADTVTFNEATGQVSYPGDH